ncbi:hypothetical protein TrCOL_g830, partial [Triparma columacea]
VTGLLSPVVNFDENAVVIDNIPYSEDAIKVLRSPTSRALVEVYDTTGKCIFKSQIAKPSWGLDGMLMKSSEENALGDLEKFVEVVKRDNIVRFTTSLEPWDYIWDGPLKQLLSKLKEKGAHLSVVACRMSDHDVITFNAHVRVFEGQTGHNVTRIEMRKGELLFKEKFVLVDTTGRCHLKGLSGNWDSDSLGNAKEGDLTADVRKVQEKALEGLGCNILHCSKEDVTKCVKEVFDQHPRLKNFENASCVNWDELWETLDCWNTDLTDAKAGANYLLIYSHKKVDVKRLLTELMKPEYNCLGMDVIRQALQDRVKADKGDDIVKAVNSGETTRGGRPSEHINDMQSGNPLPRNIARAFNKLERDSVTVANSVREAWTSKHCILTAIEAAKKRMLLEALWSILLLTQQAASDKWREKQNANTRGEGVFVIGMNFISCGLSSMRDPLRAASFMQSGEQGNCKLLELRKSAHLVVPVEFLVDRLGEKNVLSEGITREAALNLTAIKAYAMYMSKMGSYSEALIMETITKLGGEVMTDKFSNEDLSKLKDGVKYKDNKYDITKVVDRDTVNLLKAMASSVLGKRHSEALIMETITTSGGEVKTDRFSNEDLSDLKEGVKYKDNKYDIRNVKDRYTVNLLKAMASRLLGKRYSEALIMETITTSGGMVMTDKFSNEDLSDLKEGVKYKDNKYDITKVVDRDTVNLLKAMASSVLGKRYSGSEALIMETITTSGGMVMTDWFST